MRKRNSNYGQWSINEKEQVVMCPFNCPKKHEHLIGTYESAMIYFTGSTKVAENSKHWGDLFNIVITHQLDDRFFVKTSAELFDILMKNAATKKYWIPENEREKEIFSILKKSKEKNLIFDKEILATLKGLGEKATASQKRRIYRQEQFEKYIEEIES